jgi:ABC-type uncharacterized transport system ATPase component
MNERIKELAAQAGASRRAGVGGLVFRDSELEKFAELIVKECMAVAAKQRKPANLNYNPGERFVEDLRQHFGVEE